jgi:hypothetical protein
MTGLANDRRGRPVASKESPGRLAGPAVSVRPCRESGILTRLLREPFGKIRRQAGSVTAAREVPESAAWTPSKIPRLERGSNGRRWFTVESHFLIEKITLHGGNSIPVLAHAETSPARERFRPSLSGAACATRARAIAHRRAGRRFACRMAYRSARFARRADDTVKILSRFPWWDGARSTNEPPFLSVAHERTPFSHGFILCGLRARGQRRHIGRRCRQSRDAR